MIEQEIKFVISESMMKEYKNILDGLVKPKRVLQINYYFDTPDFYLYSLGNTLRIRQKDQQLALQYKYEKQNKGIQRICKEFEMKIPTFLSNIPCYDLPGKIIKKDIYFGFVGSMTTERLNYIYKGTVISLDKNYYLGNCDYEIEVEFQDYTNAETIIKLIGIEKLEINERGKYSRFVKRFQQLRSKTFEN